MTDKITIKHRYTNAVLFEYQPTAALELIACHARLWAPEAKAVQPDEAAA